MLWSQLSLEFSVHRYFEKALSKKVHGTIPQGIEGGFECTVFQRNLKEWQGRGGGDTDICLQVLKESKALRLDTSRLRERREGRAKMSDVPAETGKGLWESLKCAREPIPRLDYQSLFRKWAWAGKATEIEPNVYLPLFHQCSAWQ